MSGLIFVALALVWAIVLIPMALRHHDEAAKTRAVDKFSDDMRVLARREAVTDREARLVVRPAAPVAPTPVEKLPVARKTPVAERAETDVRAPRSPQAHRRAAAAAARRRRRILAVLLIAVVVVGVGVPLGWFLPWAPAVPASLTLLFLVLARITVRRDHRRRSAERAASRRTSSDEAAAGATAEPAEPRVVEAVETPVARMREPALVETQVRNEQGLAVVSGLDDTSSFPVGLLADLEPTTDAGALWDPLPMTLPTYVTKPRAARSVRTIDLQEAGVSSSGRDAADSALVAEAATSRDDSDEARKAVGS